MNTPSIYRSLAFSLFIHISFFVAAFFIIKHSNTDKNLQPFVVSLVEDMKYSVSPSSGSSADNAVNTTEPQSKQIPPVSQSSSAQKSEKSKKQDENIVKERIAALQAKKKVEKIVALRKVIDIEGQRSIPADGKQKSLDKTSPGGALSSSAVSGYSSIIVKRIRQEWVFPENLDRNLEAIVSIKIAKDGTIKIDKIEKSSGNPVFDRYALRAINKASPLPPPPHEMEVGVRFYP